MRDDLPHLATFVSLIYGLGVANVLVHIGALIRRGRDADWFWVHTVWSAYLLVAMASFWWLLQVWRAVESIGYLSYLSMLLIPSILFVISELMFPERGAAGAVDLKEHFFKVKRPFFWLMLALLFADQLDSIQKGWQHVLDLGPQYWITQVVVVTVAAIGLRSQSVRVQGALAVFTLALFVFGMLNAEPFI